MFLLSLLACSGVNEDSFPEKYSEAVCNLFAECSRADFLEEWDDVDECAEDYIDIFEDGDVFDGCDFDKDKAKDCLDDLKDAAKDCDIDDLYDSDDCDEVYDCDDAGDDDDYDSGRWWDTGRRSAIGFSPASRAGAPRLFIEARGELLWIATSHDASWARVDWLDDDGQHGAVDALPTAFAARGPAYTELEGTPPWMPWGTPAAYVVRSYGLSGELVECSVRGPDRERLLFDDSYAIADAHELLRCDRSGAEPGAAP